MSVGLAWSVSASGELGEIVEYPRLFYNLGIKQEVVCSDRSSKSIAAEFIRTPGCTVVGTFMYVTNCLLATYHGAWVWLICQRIR